MGLDTLNLPSSTTFFDGTFVLENTTDPTKTLVFNLANQPTNTRITLNMGAQTASRTVSLPVLTANDTYVMLGVAQTLTGLNTFSALITASAGLTSSSVGIASSITGSSLLTLVANATTTATQCGLTFQNAGTAEWAVYKDTTNTLVISDRVNTVSQMIFSQGTLATGTISIPLTKTSGGSANGALVVTGGVGIGGTLNVAGAVGIGGQVSIGGTGVMLAVQATSGNGIMALAGGTGSSAILRFGVPGTSDASDIAADGLGNFAITDEVGGVNLFAYTTGSSTTASLKIGISKVASSTTSAAFLVSGGVGFTGAAFIGGLANIAGTLTSSAITVTTSSSTALTANSSGSVLATFVGSTGGGCISINMTAVAGAKEWRIGDAIGSSNGVLVMYDWTDGYPVASFSGTTLANGQAFFRNVNALSLAVTGSVGINGNAVFAQPTGFGTPSAVARVSSFPGTGATTAQCGGAISDLITVLKTYGFLGV